MLSCRFSFLNAYVSSLSAVKKRDDGKNIVCSRDGLDQTRDYGCIAAVETWLQPMESVVPFKMHGYMFLPLLL